MTAITPAGVSARRTQSPRRGLPVFRPVGWLITLAVCLAVAYPVGHVVAKIFEYDGPHWRLAQIARDAVGHDALVALGNTAAVVAAAGGGAFVVGVVLAFINERTDARLGWAADILPVLPMLVPPVAGAIGWVFLASPVSGFLNSAIRSVLNHVGVHLTQGPLHIYTWPGLIFVYMLYLTPFVYLPISAALRTLESSLEEAARVSGAGPWETMRRVTIPSLRPAVGAALLYVVGNGFAMFTVPIVIGTQAGISILPVKIVNAMTSYPQDLSRALGLGVWVVVIVGAAWWLQTRLASVGRHATIGGKGAGSTRVRLGFWKWPARLAMLLYLLATSVLPFLALLVVSLQPFWNPTILWHTLGLGNFRRMIHDSQLGVGLKNSVFLGLTTATITILLTAVVISIVQSRRSRVGRLADGVMKLPLVVPHVVFAVALVLAFAGAPFHWSGTFFILGLGYLILYLPQAAVQSAAAFAQVGAPLREAAAVAGAGPGRIFRSVLLPLMTPQLAAGWALLFVLMAGDVTASVMLAGSKTPVVGFVIVNEWETGTFAGIAALSVIIAAVSSVIVLTVLRFSRTTRFSIRA
ncbi:MAG: ABC transporter permease subunit [Actinomycetota bacterium]